MNVEASNEAMEELTTTFRYNDAVIRNLVIRRDEPVTEESFIMKAEKENRERKSRYEERQAADAARAEIVESDDNAEDVFADDEADEE
jgi:small subunit ribosomal protein S6